MLLILLVASCRYLSLPAASDLRLVSVNLVPQSQIPQHDKYWDNGVITAPLVRVTFTSGRDFQALARSQYYVGQVTAFCRAGKVDPGRKLQGFSYLYDSGGPIDEYASRNSSSNQGATPNVSHLYFDVEQHGIYGFKPYDLRNNPEDVCIQLVGYKEFLGEWPLWRFHSNVLVVPKSMLIAALAR